MILELQNISTFNNFEQLSTFNLQPLHDLSNNYFQFKQFTIQQDKCAMKVCTDACLFGALVADNVEDKNLLDIFDIGTGTGLLPLMLAQKTTALIDTIEIDTDAFEQAKENMAASQWAKRLIAFNEDIKQFNFKKKYDCIISNPPFFENDLKSKHSNKNAAKHDTTLTLQQLLDIAQKYLQPNGFFAVLLPWHRLEYCIGEAEKNGLFLSQKILVKQTPRHDYFRCILFFSRQQSSVNTEEIIIKNETGNYSEKFIELLKDYYLYL